MKKVLMISPTPTHPQNAGNRSRVFNVAELLKKNGYHVHYLLTEVDDPDLDAMSAYWKAALHIYNPLGNNLTVPVWKLFANKLRTAKFIFRRKIKRVYYQFRYKGDFLKYNNLIDDFYSPHLQKYLWELQRKHHFNIVLVEYVYLSRAFLAFDETVLKLLDTHDILSNRFLIFLEKGLQPEWFSFFKEEESIGFNRADIIIAIQEEEMAAVKELTEKKVVLLGHTVNTSQHVSSLTFRKRLVFVASHNSINVNGINAFIDEIFPEVRKHDPEVSLRLVGSIIKAKNQIQVIDGVEFTGEVNEISEAYEQADIVINPVRLGTGLKIKTIEALSFGKPLVTFSAGLIGLKYQVDYPFCLICETNNDFIQAILELIQDQGLRNQLKQNSLRFAERYNDQVTSEFLKTLQDVPLS